MPVRRATVYAEGVLRAWRACAAARDAGDLGRAAVASWRVLIAAEALAVLTGDQVPELEKLRGAEWSACTLGDAVELVDHARCALAWRWRHVEPERRARLQAVADAWADLVRSELCRSRWAAREAAAAAFDAAKGPVN